MKNLIKLTLLLFALSFSLNAADEPVPLPPESKPDLELTCEEADARIANLQGRVDAVAKQLAEAKAALVQAEATLAKTKLETADCEKEILTLIGATNADVEAFRQILGVLEGKVRQMKNLSNDELADRRSEVEALEAELNELRTNKLSVIPEFYNKIESLSRDIKGLYREKKVTGYTVGT